MYYSVPVALSLFSQAGGQVGGTNLVDRIDLLLNELLLLQALHGLWLLVVGEQQLDGILLLGHCVGKHIASSLQVVGQSL